MTTDELFDARTEARQLAGMLARIAVIVFVVETLVMFMLAGWQLTRAVLTEAFIDSTLLSLFASPLIYRWAAKPFAVAAHDAQAALGRELEARSLQSRQLEVTLAEQNRLLMQNEQLRAHLQQSTVEFSDINERLLQRIGADLHDGPAQLLALALIRLHKFLPLDTDTTIARSGATQEELQRIREALEDTLREVRNLSTGLVLPELEQRSLADCIFLAIAAHEDRTDTTVSFDVGELPKDASHALKVCVYRLVQEGLTNALQHAGGRGQRVESHVEGGKLVVRVLDRGPGIRDTVADERRGLGLPGLRGRVEAIGGTFALHSIPGDGTTVSATFSLEDQKRVEDIDA